MKTIIVDDELWAIDQLKNSFYGRAGIELEGCFRDPLQALSHAENNTVDFALLDVKMNGMDGIELGRRLRQLYPAVIIVYVSSYPRVFFRRVQRRKSGLLYAKAIPRRRY